MMAVAILHGWEPNPATQGYFPSKQLRPAAWVTARRYRARMFKKLYLWMILMYNTNVIW